MLVAKCAETNFTDSQKHGLLYSPIMLCLGIGIVIYIIAMSTLNVGARYFAMMLTPISNGAFCFPPPHIDPLGQLRRP